MGSRSEKGRIKIGMGICMDRQRDKLELYVSLISLELFLICPAGRISGPTIHS